MTRHPLGAVVCVGLAVFGGCGPSVATPAGSASGNTDETGPPPIDERLSCAEIPPDAPTFGPEWERAAPWFPNTACNPRGTPDDGPYACCSDDPAAWGGELPAYDGRGIDGAAPLFSGSANDMSTSGVCVRVSDIDDGLTETAATGCPVPCNPTSPVQVVETICGPKTECCQTRELGPKDCIEVDGTWRPATGADVIAGHTTWAPAEHDTHQDPNGVACMEYMPGEHGDVFWDCVAQLTVADQRGLCRPEGSCPIDPGYVDPCEAMN
jgi:hypothetical protein